MHLTQHPWARVLAALCTCLLGLGLARFAYTPLVPALIAAHWFTPGQAAYLGAANIAGYLAGALAARKVAHRLGTRTTLRLCLVLATAQFFACAQPAGFVWFLAWRGLSGVAGAGLMVLAAPAVLQHVPARHRGLAGGIIFTGIGFGILAAGTLLPALLRVGLTQGWLALGVGGLAASVAAWVLLPADEAASGGPAAARPKLGLSAPMRALFAAYALSAAGQVPVILFLADFVARSLDRGVAGGAAIWAWVGVGALAGPLVAGVAADRIGHMPALRWLWVTQILANAVLLAAARHLVGSPAAIALAGAVAGAGIPALVVLVLGRSQVLAGAREEARSFAWSRATIAFALGQAVGAYGLSAVFADGQRYDVLFGAGVVFMAAAMMVARGANVRQGLLF